MNEHWLDDKNGKLQIGYLEAFSFALTWNIPDMCELIWQWKPTAPRVELGNLEYDTWDFVDWVLLFGGITLREVSMCAGVWSLGVWTQLQVGELNHLENRSTIHACVMRICLRSGQFPSNSIKDGTSLAEVDWLDCICLGLYTSRRIEKYAMISRGGKYCLRRLSF